MSTPHFYCWDDAGSPGRALSGNLQNRLKQILVPCLVTGYGNKPGAGWTIGHEHPNGFSLINADGNVVNFVSNLAAKSPYPSMGPRVIHVYAAESLTDSSEAVISGANLCSGPFRAGSPEASGYPRHTIHASRGLDGNDASLVWTVIADDRTVCISSSTSYSESSGNAEGQFNLYFGSTLINGGFKNTFVALGGMDQAFSGDSYSGSSFSGGNTSLRNLKTGLAEYSQAFCQPYAANTAYNYTNVIGGVPPSLRLQPPSLWSGGGFVGVVRGCVFDPALAVYGRVGYLKALGFTGTSYADRNKIVTIGDYQYAYLVGSYGGFIMTNDPDFW